METRSWVSTTSTPSSASNCPMPTMNPCTSRVWASTLHAVMTFAGPCRSRMAFAAAGVKNSWHTVMPLATHLAACPVGSTPTRRTRAPKHDRRVPSLAPMSTTRSSRGQQRGQASGEAGEVLTQRPGVPARVRVLKGEDFRAGHHVGQLHEGARPAFQ